jgi:hypothetical protein
MLVFKGGPVKFVGYLLDATSGSYGNKILGKHAISNASLYGRGTPDVSAFPVPAGLLLILSAFAGAGLVSCAARRAA